MQPGETFIPREIFGAPLRPEAVRYSPELSAEAKTAWFVLALYAVFADADYPTFPHLQKLLGVGRVKARQLIAELEERQLIAVRPCAGSRKRRFVFLWQPFYEKRLQPPRKLPARAELQDIRSIVLALEA